MFVLFNEFRSQIIIISSVIFLSLASASSNLEIVMATARWYYYCCCFFLFCFCVWLDQSICGWDIQRQADGHSIQIRQFLCFFSCFFILIYCLFFFCLNNKNSDDNDNNNATKKKHNILKLFKILFHCADVRFLLLPLIRSLLFALLTGWRCHLRLHCFWWWPPPTIWLSFCCRFQFIFLEEKINVFSKL